MDYVKTLRSKYVIFRPKDDFLLQQASRHTHAGPGTYKDMISVTSCKILCCCLVYSAVLFLSFKSLNRFLLRGLRVPEAMYVDYRTVGYEDEHQGSFTSILGTGRGLGAYE